MEQLKKRLDQGEVVIGTFLSLGNPATTEIVATAGFDWVIIDLEHGIGTEADLVSQLLAVKSAGIAGLVRVESYQRERIQRVLDLGATGIMCPKILSSDEAAQAVKAMHFPPDGIRGVAKMTRATGYGQYFDEYRNNTKTNLLGIVQIETREALDHLDAIAAIEEVDVLFIGPSDLSMALGIFGQMEHPLFTDTVSAIVAAAGKYNKHVGILLPDASGVESCIKKGIRFIGCGTDASFLSKGAKQTAAAMREASK